MSTTPGIIVYRGIGISTAPIEGDLRYVAMYRGQRYEHGVLAEVKAWIDAVLGPIPPELPPDQRQTLQPAVDERIEVYRECSIYRKGAAELFWSPCVAYLMTSSAEAVRAAIDVLKGPLLEEEAPEEVIVLVPSVGVPELPWYAAWLKPFIDYVGSLVENVVNYTAPIFRPIADGVEALVALPAGIVDAANEGLPALFQKGRNKGADIATETLGEVLKGTEPWMSTMNENVGAVQQGVLNQYSGAAAEALTASEAGDPDKAATALEEMKNKVLAAAVANFSLHAVLESGTLGQIEFLRDLDPMVTSKLGLDEVIRQATLIPIERAVITPATQAWARRHPNEIPAASQLVEMVIKEVITLDDFKAEMLKLGFRPEWSQRIWDAHFIPPNYEQIRDALYRGIVTPQQFEDLKALVDLDPRFKPIWDGLVEQIPPYSELVNQRIKEVIDQETFTKYLRWYGFDPVQADRIWAAHFLPPTLNDLLTAWRRGLITEERLDELMILVDLDPRFKEIFDTRKYYDISITQARYMYEVGAIDEGRVRQIILRNGYAPADADALTTFVIRFQERRFRTSYLLALATGTMYGAYTEDQVITAVTEAGYTEAVAGWILKTAEAREATRLARRKDPTPKLLTLGDLKKAYVRGFISEDELRRELGVRKFDVGDVDIMVRLLTDQAVTTEAGGRKVSLSQSELLNAWRYEEMIEDQVRVELALRGLEQDEIDILLATKRKQWGMV